MELYLTLIIITGSDPDLNCCLVTVDPFQGLDFWLPPTGTLGLPLMGARGACHGTACGTWFLLQREQPALPAPWHCTYKFSFCFQATRNKNKHEPWKSCTKKYTSRCTSPLQPLHPLRQCNIWLSPTSLLYHHVRVNEFPASLMSMFPNESFVWVSLFKYVQNNGWNTVKYVPHILWWKS